MKPVATLLFLLSCLQRTTWGMCMLKPLEWVEIEFSLCFGGAFHGCCGLGVHWKTDLLNLEKDQHLFFINKKDRNIWGIQAIHLHKLPIPAIKKQFFLLCQNASVPDIDTLTADTFFMCLKIFFPVKSCLEVACYKCLVKTMLVLMDLIT